MVLLFAKHSGLFWLKTNRNLLGAVLLTFATVCQRSCCQSVYRATKKDSPFVFHVSAEKKKAILNELKIKRLSYDIHMMPKKH